MNIRMSPKTAGKRKGGFIRKSAKFFQNLVRTDEVNCG